MPIDIKCDFCGAEINDKAALLWGPPSQFGPPDLHPKYHACKECYGTICERMMPEFAEDVRLVAGTLIGVLEVTRMGSDVTRFPEAHAAARRLLGEDKCQKSE